MPDLDEHQDGLVDRNLRRIGRAVPLPAEPTATQRNHWKQPPAEPLAGSPTLQVRRPAHGGRFMRTKRVILPAGSAVAAAVILAVMFLTPTKHSEVNAKAIVASLRETVHQGFKITCENLGTEHELISGRMWVLFRQPFSIARLFAGESDVELELGGIYGDLRMAFDEGAALAPGLAMHVALGLNPGDKWVYMQMDDVEPLVAEVGPPVLLFARLFRGGVLLDIGDVLADEDLFGSPERIVDDAAQTAPHADKASLGLGAFEIDLTGSQTNDELAGLAHRFLTGELSPAQLDDLIAKIEEHAGKVEVVEVSPGLHVLTARGLKLDEEEVGDLPAGWAEAVVVEIAYREGIGAEWLRVSNCGPARGALKLEFVDGFTPDVGLRREDFIVAGVTTVLDVGELMQSGAQLEALMSGGGGE